MRFGRIGPALVAAVTVPWLSGCALFGFPYGDDWDGDFPSPSIIATYGTGSATITLDDGTIIELTELRPNAAIDTMMGSNVRWTGPDGWSMTLTGAGTGEMFGFEALGFDRIHGGQHWTTLPGDGCGVDVERADASGLEGTASCRGMQWYDALDTSWTAQAPEPIDEPEWDAEVTFEATP